jgi:nucleoporin SEH1
VSIFEFNQTMTSFDAGHEDLIHDVAYDFYGKRLVTCSSDQRMKVREYAEENDIWEDVDNWKVHGISDYSSDKVDYDIDLSYCPMIQAHDGSILRVTWAHPEYGQVIASCSFDRTVRIWEEQEHGKLSLLLLLTTRPF